MPAAFRDGAVVRGLGLTGWISTEKNLQRTIQFTELTADNGLHLILCSLDLLSNKPESRYVLAGTMKYLLAGKTQSAWLRGALPPNWRHCCDESDLLHLRTP